MRLRLGMFVLLGALAVCARAEDTLLVSLPPALGEARARSASGDLIALLGARTSARFELASHVNTLGYLRDLEGDRFALVFEGPHVLAALAERGTLTPVAEFRYDLSYVVLVPREQESIFQLGDLGGRPLCTGQVPDLFGMHVAATIGNPAREPVAVPVADHLRRIRRLLAGDCQAATLQTTRFMTLTDRQGAEDLRIIYKSRDLPGYGVALSNRLPSRIRAETLRTLLSHEGSRAARALSVAILGGEAPLAAGDPARLRPLAGLMDTYFAW